MISDSLFRRFYADPEKYDGTVYFYKWVRSSVGPDTILLNLGAGPGTGVDVRSFKGEAAKVVGADIDPEVLENPEVDEAVLIRDGLLPMDDETFDVVVCDYVFEHVEEPVGFLTEARRVLKTGGVLFFRTPNKAHYVSLIARFSPHWFHDMAANWSRGMNNGAHEPYPTYHRLSSFRGIKSIAIKTGYRDMEFRFFEAEPSYLKFSTVPFLAGVAYERMVNSTDALGFLRANIFGRLVK